MSFYEKRSRESYPDKRHERDKGREHDEQLKALLSSNLSMYFELLVLTYTKKLIAFVKLNDNSHYAEDIVQETFINAYYALKRISAEEILSMNIRAWLYRITRNNYLNYRTRFTKFPPVSTDLPEGRDLLETTENGQYPSPDKEVEQKEMYEELYLYISLLPNKFRLPVFLHYICELEYQEVAEVLNQPLNTVKSNGLRGFRKLKSMMEKEVKAYEAW